MRRGREPSRSPSRLALRHESAPTTATIVPFPIAARHNLIGRIVQQMLARSAAEAEQLLEQHVSCQERTLYKKQIAPDVIARELESLRGQVRAGLWRAVLCGSPR
jgi:hypothetical protein